MKTPKEKSNPRVGLGVLIFNSKNQILLGKRIGSHGESTWAPPGGHVEFGESFEACATREAREETGLKIKNFELAGLTNDVFLKEEKHYITIFMKTDLPEGQTVKNLEPHKTEEWQWFNLEKLPTPLFLTLENLLEGRCYQATQNPGKLLASSLI